MAKNAPKQQEPEAAEEAPPPKKKGKKLLLIVALVVVLAAGGGATWFFGFRGKSDRGGQVEAKAQPAKPPVFVNLEPFTVNLQPEGGEQYLQVVATLKVLDNATGESVKTQMPEIRHRILLLLSSKRASEITPVEGRERLADEVRREANLVIWTAQGKAPPKAEPAKPIGEAPAAEAKPAAAEKPVAEGEGSAAPAATPAAPAANPPAPAGEGQAAADAVVPVAATTAKPAASSKPGPDDPVQNVFFTSFIIQ